MGRELRRVPLDFDWPLNKVWEGFLNPLGKPCPENQKTCFNGLTAAGQWMETFVRLIVTAADDALESEEGRKRRGTHYPHPYLTTLATAPTYDIPRELKGPAAFRELDRRERERYKWVLPPTKELADLLAGFDKPSFMGFMGGSAGYKMRNALLKAAKQNPKTWGVCPVCKGDSMDPAVKKAYDEWESTPPPEGEGWQLWETVSEGSPISPVLPTREAFIEYLMSQGSTRSAAEAFAKEGWVPSGISDGKGNFVSGIEVAEAMQRK